MPHDCLIVGAGFAGSTMARLLADAGQRVLVIDKRDHIGGNAYDYVNEHGVRIHKYGPHIFHTNCDRVFEFLSRFTEWRPYEHRVLSSVNGALVPFPISIRTLEALYGREFDDVSMRGFLAGRVAQDWPEGREVRTAEDQVISQIGRELCELFFAGYTRKMWGVDASQLDKSVTARIPLRFNRDDRYFTDRHQAMPKDGYTVLFERMLDHPNIRVDLGWGHPSLSARDPAKKCVWTAPIDKAFDFRFGRLPYRSMRFDLDEYDAANPGGAMTTNYPGEPTALTRITNMGALTATNHDGRSVMVWEYPTAYGDPYYPIPAPENRALYERYRELADKQSNVIFLGRLGTYQYLNMDQTVGQAMAAFRRLGVG